MAGQRSISPVERAVYEQFGLEPGLDRAAILPFAGRRNEGNLEWAAPQFVYDLAKAFVAPGVALRGEQVSPEDALNVGLNVVGGGLGASAVAGPSGRSVIGMAVKAKGGNWIESSIDRFLEGAKKPAESIGTLANVDALPENTWVTLGDQGVTKYVKRVGDKAYTYNEPAYAVNNWVDTKLRKYVKNEMAAPDDPVRKLADEEGVLHFEPNVVGYVPVDWDAPTKLIGTLPSGRREQFAETDLGRVWEEITDASVSGRRARDYTIDDPAVDAVTKRDPETPIFEIPASSAAAMTRRLGLSHLTDELYNAVDPNSDLPERLKLTPKKLQKMSVPQAVKHVAKINKWREESKSAANLAIANNEATFPLIEYDNGTKWVELRMPTEEDGPVKYTVNDLEYDGVSSSQIHAIEDYKAWTGGETPEENGYTVIPVGERALEEALRYEGDQMGHCVGGYCDEVLSGSSRIFSLRDKKGEPHVTIEVVNESSPFSGIGRVSDLVETIFDTADPDDVMVFAKEFASELGVPPSEVTLDFLVDAIYESLRSEHGKYINPAMSTEIGLDILKQISPKAYNEIANRGPTFTIEQIKGRANKTPAKKYVPAIKDFIKKMGIPPERIYEPGPWSED